MTEVLEGLAILSGVVLGAGGVALAGYAAWLSHDDDHGTWTVAELAAIPRPAGRHRLMGERAADTIGRPGWIPRHDEDEVPPTIRSVTMELPVVDRAKTLAWTIAPNRKPAPRDLRMRRVQLELARRLRAHGVPCRLTGPRAGTVLS